MTVTSDCHRLPATGSQPAWFYDPAILTVSPRIGFASPFRSAVGAFWMKVGSNEAPIANATATSAERRNRYREGSHLPTGYSILWSRRGLIAAYGGDPPSFDAPRTRKLKIGA